MVIKRTQEEFNKLSWKERDDLNRQAFKDHQTLIAKGECIHDLTLPLYSTTCNLRNEGKDAICEICKEVIEHFE